MAKRRGKVRQKRNLGFPIAIGVLILGGLALIVSSRSNPPERPEPPEGVQTFTDLARDHVDPPVEYAVLPPPGGPHFQTWQNCGFYSEPVMTEAAVHSLEHGSVWITFEPDLDEDDIGALRRLAGTPYVLVSPFEGNPSPVVASAWGNQLQLDSVDDPRLAQFVGAFARSPDAPEPGAVCSGGIGEPE